MGFPQFVEVYMEDMKPRLKLNTFLTKKHIMETKIIPYFEKKSLAEITATDVIQWQNQLLSMRDENGMPYSQTYLRTIQNQLSAIFNHACRFYGLTANPSKPVSYTHLTISNKFKTSHPSCNISTVNTILYGTFGFSKSFNSTCKSLMFFTLL